MLADRVAACLARNGMQYAQVRDWPETLQSFTEIWIVGGDGTLNYFVNRYADCRLPLSVFAGGTGNDFHWMLYGNMDIDEQVMHVLKSNPAAVDAGMCNGRLFLNTFGVGFDGRVARDLAGRKKKPGKASYYFSVLRNILTYKNFSARLEGEAYDTQYFMLNVNNGRRTGGGFLVTPGAYIDDGLLQVTNIQRIGWCKRLRYLPVLEKGLHQHKKLSFIEQYATTAMTINCMRAVDAHLDGEWFSSTNFDLQCLPGRFFFRY